MFPFGDNLRGTGGTADIAGLILLFFVAQTLTVFDASAGQGFLRRFGFTPLEFSVAPWPNTYKLVSSVFLHGDWFHLAGNCLFLWVFGRSLLRLFGPLRFWLTFPFLGATGLLFHWALHPNSGRPVIGASGAVAALMGAYLALFPGARIRIFALIGGFGAPFTAPAWAFLLYWGGFELFSLISSQGGAQPIAYAVHVGSFIFGAMVAIMWKVGYPYADETLSEFASDAFKT